MKVNLQWCVSAVVPTVVYKYNNVNIIKDFYHHYSSQTLCIKTMLLLLLDDDDDRYFLLYHFEYIRHKTHDNRWRAMMWELKIHFGRGAKMEDGMDSCLVCRKLSDVSTIPIHHSRTKSGKDEKKCKISECSPSNGMIVGQQQTNCYRKKALAESGRVSPQPTLFYLPSHE